MANSNYPAGAFFKHTSVIPSVLKRGWKKAAKQTALDRCYELVDKRDGCVCQVTGVALKADHADRKKRLTRDHLGPRSTHPEDRANADNVITVSQRVHDLLQASALYPIDKHGEETIRVSRIWGWRWNENYFTGGQAKPFRLPKDRVA